MEQGISEFLKGMQTPVKKLTIKELRERETTWRALWSWIPDIVKYYVLRVGQTLRVIKRDYKGSTGELGAVKFQLEEVELHVVEKSYNQTDGKYYYEDKVVLIPSGVIAYQEFLVEVQPFDEAKQPDVMGLDEEEPVTSHNLGG